MSQDARTIVTGEVVDVFAHRFTVRTATGMILADLGPHGLRQLSVSAGDRVELAGEMTPSELKVAWIAKAGEKEATRIAGKPAARPDHGTADPAAALRTVAAHGFTVVGEPRGKPRHFEILGRDKGGGFVELHVDVDGTLRKSRPVPAGDEKWAAALWKAG